MSLEDMVKSLANSTCQMRQDQQRFQQDQQRMQQDQQRFQQETRSSIRTLEAQMSQLASSLSSFENGKGKLSSQVIPNPKENASAMLLRSGKEVQSSKSETTGDEDEQVSEKLEREKVSSPSPIPKAFDINSPFPGRFAKAKKEELENEILDTFRKVEINIPLLETIRQLPKYARFLKGLCTNRNKLNLQDKVRVGENVSAVLQRKLPQKCKDPGPLNDTRVVIQLADRSNVYPEGVVEDVLVKVNEFIFPADFYIVNMNDDNSVNSTVLLLSRPFMSTVRTKIDVYEGTLSVEFDGEMIMFNIFDGMKYPNDTESINYVGVTNSIVQDHLEQNPMEDKLKFMLQQSKTNSDVESEDEEDTIEAIMSLHSFPVLPDRSAPGLELKELPKHLKYAYLVDHNTLPIIIANDLTVVQEKKLLRVLREYKPAIRWTLAGIKGINPSICIHHILLESEAKPVRERQRKLNPAMKEVVINEILKLLELGTIFPISDGEWVSPVHVVPKKTGITLVRNEKNELVPMKLQNGWRMCIDFRKLNAATRKDHFPLPFIDEMLERLAETFQKCMMSIFSDMIENCIKIFMDDFTVYGDSFDQCLHHLTKVLQRCIDTNLVLNYEKCHFMVKEGIVLGHVVSSRGIEVDKAKVDLINSLPCPANVKEIHSFLGHAGFYRRFIKDFSRIAQPLSQLLQKEVTFDFGEACKLSFDTLKNMLTTAPIIQPPDWSLSFELMCDASQ
ncbi:uncharacterized protein [Coffea arabica]|uniref:Reverse transcriptase domain-containing protein n=1 Tax=Coffea arabica TaxID=13443 RepID=A0ABM4V9U3_COFAR